MQKPGDTFSAENSEHSSQRGSNRPEADTGRAWQLAHDRLMLYLELLQIPRQQAAELATEAIRRAEQRPSGEHPVKNAMRALHALPVGNTIQVASMPPLNRGPMVTVEIDRQPWWTFFKKRILRKK
ncbi:MAG: hypothetical protein NTV89_14540 [Proteobacteria bacterium]|nr:hypothetical protein [Pseudomonadota bacterium]